LLTYLAIAFADQYGIGSNFVESVWGRGAFDMVQQEFATEFISRSAKLYFPGYVLIEALQLRKSLWKNREAEFVRFAQEFVKTKLTELPLTVNEIYADANLRGVAQHFGIADAAVLYAAARESADILTDDEDLFQHMPDVPNFKILLFRHLIDGAYRNA